MQTLPLLQDARNSMTSTLHGQSAPPDLMGVNGDGSIRPANSGSPQNHPQGTTVELQATANSQLEWYDTEDILALLTANDTSWLQSLPELHMSPFSEPSSQNAEDTEGLQRVEAAFTDRGQQAMQRVKQSLRDLVSYIFFGAGVSID
jgi:hypothetical protein